MTYPLKKLDELEAVLRRVGEHSQDDEALLRQTFADLYRRGKYQWVDSMGFHEEALLGGAARDDEERFDDLADSVRDI